MQFGLGRVRHLAAMAMVLAVGAGALLGPLGPAAVAATPGRAPDLVTGSTYLAAPANLKAGHYYESFPHVADFGLTIDGALALAATGDDNPAYRKIVAFIEGGRDPRGKTVNDWTGIGTRYTSGGAIGKEVLLAQVTGANPRHFGGRDLLAALDASICPRSFAGGRSACPAAGSYHNAASIFDQALGVLAQLRAGQARQAAAPIAYLESLQRKDGAFPSLIPVSGGPDVDSTAMAVMALALAPGPRAATTVRSGLAWIAAQQQPGGGFLGVGGESVNSAGLAIQALSLRAASYRSRIRAALAFLAAQQNRDGGFRADAGGQRGSNLRASTQAVGGAAGIPFGTLHRDLTTPAARAPHRGTPASAQAPASGAWSTCTATTGVIVAVDFGHWGGPVLRSCGTTPTTGFALLNQGGWHTTGTTHDGPGFICRIGYSGYHHGTQYPAPSQQPCVQTPPARAYWASWQAGPGQTSWTYSQAGAMSYHPRPGSVTLWVFGGTNLSGTTGSARPRISPAQLRATRAAGTASTGTPKIFNADPAAPSTSVSHSSPLPTLLAVAIAALLAAAGVTVARRRRREQS